MSYSKNDASAVAKLNLDIGRIGNYGGSSTGLLVDFASSRGAGDFLQQKVHMARTYGASNEVVAEIVRDSVNGPRCW